MAAFAKYYLDFLFKLVTNIMIFFQSIGTTFKKAFWDDIYSYFQELGTASKSFDFFGYVTLILVSLINYVLLFFLLYRLFQVIRRYVLFRAKEVEKDELIEEIARLKIQADNLVKEKAQILSLRMSELTGGYGRDGQDGMLAIGAGEEGEEIALDDASKPLVEGQSRFSKLTYVDKKYKTNPVFINMTENDTISLADMIKRFVNFAASQLKLYYDEKTVRTFISGLATSKIIILEGISGTGKTSLPYAMGKFFDNDAKIVSVQPSWRDRAELMGYLNEFTKKFNESDFLMNLYEATYRDDLNFIVIDEMNLARIEYYFAEFLSIMEMPDINEWKIDIVPSFQDTDPSHIVDGKILVPQNVWFVGTANQDDSTFTITDKVYDRAVSLEINKRCEYFDAPMTVGLKWSYDYLDMLFKKARQNIELSPITLEALNIIDEMVMNKFRIAFGNRILKQMKIFIPVYIACGGDEVDAFDFMLSSKIIRKFGSLNLAFLIKEMNELINLLEKLFGKGRMALSIGMLRRFQKNV